jgi:hypothetical protein
VRTLPASPLRTGVVARWVQLGPEGRASVRAVTTAAICPVLRVGAQERAMAIRSRPAPPAWPVLVCEASLADVAGPLSIDGEPLPSPARSPRRIAILGDTGCRMKGKSFQACNDPRAWPFATLARTVAAYRPDLVVHVGDYHYREAPCPAGNAGCAGSPWGDTWAAWDVDLFAPAAPLFGAAPWIAVRGNHEICSRAGDGWFRLLDAHAPPETCSDTSLPFAVPAGDLNLLVLDSAAADDRKAPVKATERYRRQLASLAPRASPASWLFTHKPFWGIVPLRGGEDFAVPNATLQSAARGGLPAGLQVVFAGHIHILQILGFAGPRPAQVVVGNSATSLVRPLRVALAGRSIDGAAVEYAKVLASFGFMTAEPGPEGWTLTARDLDGRGVATCALRGTSVSCK